MTNQTATALTPDTYVASAQRLNFSLVQGADIYDVYEGLMDIEDALMEAIAAKNFLPVYRPDSYRKALAAIRKIMDDLK